MTFNFLGPGLSVNVEAKVKEQIILDSSEYIINIENLANLDQCGSGLFNFSCFPLKLENADGAPTRAVAWWE